VGQPFQLRPGGRARQPRDPGLSRLFAFAPELLLLADLLQHAIVLLLPPALMLDDLGVVVAQTCVGPHIAPRSCASRSFWKVSASPLRASVSHETFYEMYPTKQDAYLGTQRVGMHQAFTIAVEAYEAHRQESWPRGIAEGLRALIAYLQSEPAHPHMSIVDTFAASPETLAIRDEILAGFAVYFRLGERPPMTGIDVPAIAPEAVVGGVWQVLHHYIANGCFDELVQAIPQLTYFIGPKEAAKAARRPPAGSADSAAPAGG
jgi:hypothetical protein